MSLLTEKILTITLDSKTIDIVPLVLNTTWNGQIFTSIKEDSEYFYETVFKIIRKKDV